jgi:anti-sigma regulatory factor (Ser/Thr protein kinase)
VRDPGSGFRLDSLSPEVFAHKASQLSEDNDSRKEGQRPSGYGLLLAAGTVDELIYSDVGNEVVLIKYLVEPLDAQAQT